MTPLSPKTGREKKHKKGKRTQHENYPWILRMKILPAEKLLLA
jgi:hypothetical protein